MNIGSFPNALVKPNGLKEDGHSKKFEFISSSIDILNNNELNKLEDNREECGLHISINYINH